MSGSLRIVALGYIVRGPLGGLAWHHLQYVLGLAQLGHDVYFLEDSGDTPWCCYDPERDLTDSDPTYGLRFAANAFSLVGLADRWAYWDAHEQQWHGPAGERALSICRDADILINLSCANPIRPWMEHIPVRVMVDTDPAFNQVRNLTDPKRRREATRHTAFFSYAENISCGATIPVDGFPWRPTRQPVVLDSWPVVPGPPGGKFTTAMHWDSYSVREYRGRRFGMKSESFAPYLDLPQRVGPIFELLLGASKGSSLLAEHGWILRNPHKTIPGPEQFRQFVRESKAEFTVAKSGFVVTRSGWFSDRSATYLASGRPVVTQDTGYAGLFPTGDGLLSFDTPDGAVAAIADVTARYAHHCRAARVIAEEYFDARKVLSRLLEESFSPATGREQRGGSAETGERQSEPELM